MDDLFFNESINSTVIPSKIDELSRLAVKADNIDPTLYAKSGVFRGLRNNNGEGLRVGLTNITEIEGQIKENGKSVPTEGKLFYRGYNIKDIIKGIPLESHFGFEECAYLLLFGELPNLEQLKGFAGILSDHRRLPSTFVRDIIMKNPSEDVMNALARSVLALFSFDPNAEDTSIPNVIRQCLQLIAQFPLLTVYSYQAYRHFHLGKTLVIHNPKEDYSTSENILHMLRPDMKFSPLEAKLLDLLLILHMDHGGGSNSAFTTRLVTTSGTDTYACMSAAIASLKGPAHGGSTPRVLHMLDNIALNVKDWDDDEEISAYLLKILNKEANDHTGNLYGIGHAVYSLSDPRNIIIRKFVELLSHEKGLDKEFALYSAVERLAPQVISEHRKMYKGVSANLEFYSGFVYSMLNIPEELFTPMFAVARIAGWSAHRLEELCAATKIIRPAYTNITKRRDFIQMADR